LARQKVMLSSRVIAYYGLIRNSRPPFHQLMDYMMDLCPTALYGLVSRGSPICSAYLFPTVPSPVPRRSGWLPSAIPSPPVLAFATSAQARQPQPHTRRFSHGKCNVAAKFALCYGPEESLALHRQGRLLSSFRLAESPHPDVEYNYAGKQPIPAAGLSPARYAALWAANRGTKR
jgi:hypothetical protein